MKKVLWFAGPLAVATALTHTAPGDAQQQPGFTLSPEPLVLTAPVGGDAYGLVTVTTRRPVVIKSPASFGTAVFSDTQNGTCWQTFESQGSPLRARTTCTIEVQFHPTAAGAVTDTMTVYQCTSWHWENGQIVCDATGPSQSIALQGTGTGTESGLPDLTVSGIAITAPSYYPAGSYTVTLRNAGTATADLTSVVLQGYYSTDTTIDGNDAGGCGVTASGTLAPGATTDVVVGCSVTPPSGEYLLVDVDITNAVAESDETNNVGVALVP